MSTTSAKDESPSNEYLIYPNPSSAEFYIELGNSMSGIEVFDPAGKLILNEQATDVFKIDLSGYPKGTYILRIDANNRRVLKKLILE